MQKIKVSFHNFTTLSKEDVDIVYQMRNSDYVRKYSDNSRLFSYDTHVKFVSSLKTDSSKLYYLIKINSKPCGVFNLVDIDKKNNSATAGIYILENFSKYSHDVSILEIYILKKHNIKKLYGAVHKNNDRAILFNLMKLKAEIIEESDKEYFISFNFDYAAYDSLIKRYDVSLVE